MAAARIKNIHADGSVSYVADFETGKPDGACVYRVVLDPKQAQVFSAEDADSARKEMEHWQNTIGQDLRAGSPHDPALARPQIEVEELAMRMMTPEEVRDAAADLADKIGFDACEDSVLYCRIEEAIREMSLYTADVQ